MAIWNILRTFGKFYDRLVHSVLIWYIFPVWVSRINKNLATLIVTSVNCTGVVTLGKVYSIAVFSPTKSRIILRFRLSMLLILYQKLIITLVLREKPICFAENW
jgi:hypothetical protein